MLAIAYLIHAYAIMKLLHGKQMIRAKAEQQVALQRKVAPYFQSVQDIEYTILKHRWDLLAKEVVGEDFIKKANYHNLVAWKPMNKNQTIWVRGGTGRYTRPMWDYFANQYMPGFEIQNI